MWNKDEVSGKVDQAKGKIKETVGDKPMLAFVTSLAGATSCPVFE